MKLSELEIGTKLELELFNSIGLKLEPLLVSEFEWYVEAHDAAIAAPIFEGNIYPVEIGTVLNAYFVSRKENVINLYKFSAMVKGRQISENLQLLIVELQSEIIKVQRRDYFRLDCLVQVQYKLVESFKTEYNENIPFKKTFANNLSGGGMCLMLEDKIEVGKLIECEIFNEQSRKVKFFGKVVRYEKTETKGKYKYEAGIAYIRINNIDRETVVRYIFEEQRKLRKRGLI